MNLAINWDVGSELIDGWKTPNLYGLLFVSGLVIGYFVVQRMFKKEGVEEKYLDKLVLYMVLATIIGARLGHVLFYGPYFGPDGYFSNPLSILKVWEGGLASHGGALAILFVLIYYSKKVIKKPVLWILDRITAPIAIAGCFIRLGNLVNHEMVGHETTVPWGFRFLHHDCGFPYTCPWEEIPIRHPSQVYESLVYLVLFIILMFLFWKKKSYLRPGLLFGVFLVIMWSGRFFIEYTKLPQVDARSDWWINTGQMLSIPFFLLGAIILWRSLKRPAIIEGI